MSLMYSGLWRDLVARQNVVTRDNREMESSCKPKEPVGWVSGWGESLEVIDWRLKRG